MFVTVVGLILSLKCFRFDSFLTLKCIRVKPFQALDHSFCSSCIVVWGHAECRCVCGIKLPMQKEHQIRLLYILNPPVALVALKIEWQGVPISFHHKSEPKTIYVYENRGQNPKDLSRSLQWCIFITTFQPHSPPKMDQNIHLVWEKPAIRTIHDTITMLYHTIPYHTFPYYAIVSC